MRFTAASVANMPIWKGMIGEHSTAGEMTLADNQLYRRD